MDLIKDKFLVGFLEIQSLASMMMLSLLASP